MNWWILFGCKLTGWSSKVLAQCSEASRSQLSKYTSALVILIIVWGIIGFCFAHRYIGLPWWACMIVSLFFVTIVVMIERKDNFNGRLQRYNRFYYGNSWFNHL